jgi:uncharacterized membrane protein
MKRWIGPLLLGTVLAVGVHFALLQAAPAFIMGKALERLEEGGIPQHGFRLSPRITPQTQAVVRSSPDLAYSLCRFDFTANGRRPLIVRAAAWSGYASLSFYDARTDNFATLRGSGDDMDTALLPPGASAAPGQLVSPSDTGVILIRRLAPDDASHARVAAIASGDRCAAQPGTGGLEKRRREG